MTPVILAAGMGTRFGGDIPKCLAPVGGEPLLAHAFRALKAAGFADARLVVGYKSAAIENWLAVTKPPISVTVVRNPEYARRSIHSLHCGARDVAGPILLIEGDLLYGARVIREICSDPRPDLVPCGPVRQERPWLIERGPDDRVLGWGYDLPAGDAELIGMYKLSPALIAALMRHSDVEYWDPMLEAGVPIHARWCPYVWAEVDTPDDLRRAQRAHERLGEGECSAV